MPATSSVAIVFRSNAFGQLSDRCLQWRHSSRVAKCQDILLTTYDRELMPERSWNHTKPGLERVLSCLFSAC